MNQHDVRSALIQRVAPNVVAVALLKPERNMGRSERFCSEGFRRGRLVETAVLGDTASLFFVFNLLQGRFQFEE